MNGTSAIKIKSTVNRFFVKTYLFVKITNPLPIGAAKKGISKSAASMSIITPRTTSPSPGDKYVRTEDDNRKHLGKAYFNAIQYR